MVLGLGRHCGMFVALDHVAEVFFFQKVSVP